MCVLFMFSYLLGSVCFGGKFGLQEMPIGSKNNERVRFSSLHILTNSFDLSLQPVQAHTTFTYI